MPSFATVVVPLYEGVIFIGALNGAELVRWFSETAQSLDAITGSQFRGAQMADQAMASWHVLSQEPLQRTTVGVAEPCAAYVSVC